MFYFLRMGLRLPLGGGTRPMRVVNLVTATVRRSIASVSRSFSVKALAAATGTATAMAALLAFALSFIAVKRAAISFPA
jgi:hypothetical protein